MNVSVELMLKRYPCENVEDYENALKEVIQEIALYGLSRTDFFQKAAFCGGTALRIFHQLDRFSEDMDFSMLNPDGDFSFQPYADSVEKAMREFGFQMDIKVTDSENSVKSAFLKGNTLYHLLEFTPIEEPVKGIRSNQKLTVKLKMDTNPPAGADYEHKISLRPNPYQVTVMNLPSLFAGKTHAILCRSYLKGRDLYDFVWYLQHEVPINLSLLENAMRQTGHYEDEAPLSLEILKELLKKRFSEIDYTKAKEDTRPFLQHPDVLDIWSSDFFTTLTEMITS